MHALSALAAFAVCFSSVSAHLQLSYPGWRGDNLLTTGRTPDDQIPIGSLGINYNNGTPEFPYGMQWMYPCTLSSNSSLRKPYTDIFPQAAVFP